MTTVNSGFIYDITYTPETQDLAITMLNNKVYTYHDVDENTYNALMASDSKGSFYNAQIKNNFALTK